MTDRLRERWRRTVPESAASEAVLAQWRWLESQYSQAWRAYHNLGHIARMFRTWDDLRPSMPGVDREVLALAVWFHDAVYDPTSCDNEAHSALEACARLPLLAVDGRMVKRVRRLVLATAAHRDVDADPVAGLLFDLDLEVLASRPVEYDRYAEAIRREYAHVPPEGFRAGRMDVLRRLLARPNLYATPAMRARLEAPARQNLEREIASLGSVLGLHR